MSAHESPAPVLIIGAGPSGLATAYHLQRLGAPFLMLERSHVGASWERYYDALKLHTRKANVALPGLPFAPEVPDFPSGKDYCRYLQSYAAQFDFPIREGVEVLGANANAHTWRLSTTQGDFVTSHLVVASGIYNTPKRPHLAGEADYTGRILHAQDYHNPAPFLGERVLVVGAGNTGVGVALSLLEAGVEVGMVVRDGVQLVPLPKSAFGTRLLSSIVESMPTPLANTLLSWVRKDFSELGLPTPDKPPLEITPVVGYEFADAVRAGKVKIHPAIECLQENKVSFVDGTLSSYDNLILATGYAPTIRFLPDVELDAYGKPKYALPGLHTVGFYYPTTKPFLLNMKDEAERVAHEVALLQKRDVSLQKAC